MPGGVAGNRTPPRARLSSGQPSCGRHCVTPRPRRSHPRCSLPRGHRRHRSTCQTERATVRRPSHTTLGSGVTRLWRRCRRQHRGVERAWQGVYGANEGARSDRRCPSDAWRRWCESWRRTSASCRAAAPAAALLSHTWPGPAHARRQARWQRAAPLRRRGVRVGQGAGRPARRRQTRSGEAVVAVAAAAAASPEYKREAACLSPTQLAPCPHAQPSRRRASVCGHLVSRVQGCARSRRQQCRRSLHPIARPLRFVAGFPPHARTHSSTDDDSRSSPPSSPHHCNTRKAGDTPVADTAPSESHIPRRRPAPAPACLGCLRCPHCPWKRQNQSRHSRIHRWTPRHHRRHRWCAKSWNHRNRSAHGRRDLAHCSAAMQGTMR